MPICLRTQTCDAKLSSTWEGESNEVRDSGEINCPKCAVPDPIAAPKRVLCVYPALSDGICDSVNGQHVGSNSVINAVVLGVTDHVSE